MLLRKNIFRIMMILTAVISFSSCRSWKKRGAPCDAYGYEYSQKQIEIAAVNEKTWPKSK